MDGRRFLEVARRLALRSSEADWRVAAGRAYYALLLESRDAQKRWGFVLPRADRVHSAVRLRFAYAADKDLNRLGQLLDRLGQLRNLAEYQIEQLSPFDNVKRTQQANDESDDGIRLLDQIDGDATRRAAAIAAVRIAFP